MFPVFLVLITCPYLISTYPSHVGPNKKDTLVLVHLFFRHGDRTPAVESNFPANPYRNETFFPYGLGQLTLQGKRRSYNIGIAMRERFANFLGPIYHPDLISATSSALGRTRMSLETMLAGLFPPPRDYRIKPSLEWQPVLFDYIPLEQDNLIATYLSCPESMNLQTKLDDKGREIYRFLSEKTGKNITNSMQLADIEDTFLTLQRLGYELPEWIKPLWPEPMKTLRTQSWYELAEQKLSTACGGILKKINEDTMAKIEGKLTPEDRKMFIYAGHDTNIVALLAALGVYDGVEINYSAYLIFEVHRINGVYGMKVFLQNYKKEEPVLLRLPKCEAFCPLETFIEITKLNYPKDPWCY